MKTNLTDIRYIHKKVSRIQNVYNKDIFLRFQFKAKIN